MTDNYEIMPAPEEPPSVTPPVKWLRNLFLIHVESLAVSLVTMVWLNNPFLPWLSFALTGGTAFCLYRLSPDLPRYRKAALFTALALGFSLLSRLALGTLTTLAASVLAIIGAYQELHAHGEALEEKDPQLSRKWRSLFLWQLLIGVLGGFTSVVATVIMVLVNMDQALITQLVIAAIGLIGLIPAILYLVYLRRMIQICQD